MSRISITIYEVTFLNLFLTGRDHSLVSLESFRFVECPFRVLQLAISGFTYFRFNYISVIVAQVRGSGMWGRGGTFLGSIIGQKEKYMIIFYGSFELYLMLS